jgi:hypothetical protein
MADDRIGRVDDEAVQVVAGLLRDRNMIDAVIGRPVTVGHLGEWIAARISTSPRRPGGLKRWLQHPVARHLRSGCLPRSSGP